MSIDHCKTATTVSKIKVDELGRSAVFLNGKREKFIKIRVDGCVVKNSLAADWVLSKERVGDIIIELKGKDVDHGTRQITATAEFWTAKKFRKGKIAALIVC